MIKLINEENIAKELVENYKLINKDTLTKIRCYIKYLKKGGYTKRDIRNKIDELMLKYYEGFVMADWDKILNSMVNKYSKAKNSEYRKANDSIIIYKEEMKLITEIGGLSGFSDIEIEKVLFAMLVLAKINDSKWVNYTSDEIFKLARFKYKARSDIRMVQREKLIYDLAHFKNDKILRVTNYGKSPSIELLFLKDEGDVELEFKIDDIENVILKYLNYANKEDYTYCIECGKEIKSKTRPKKYCNKCQKKIDNANRNSRKR